MTLTRRNALLGLGASLGALAPFPALPLPPLVAPATPPPAGPISFNGYSFFYQNNPVWHDHFAPADFLPSLRSYRWHFDGCTYDQPIISCVANGRVFKIHRYKTYGTMVFEVWVDGLGDYSGRDVFSKPLAGAARYAAEWACQFPLGMPESRWETPAYIGGHKGAVYIDFSPDDLASPVTTDAPPLLIHDRLDLARPWVIDEEEDSDDDEEDEDDETA